MSWSVRDERDCLNTVALSRSGCFAELIVNITTVRLIPKYIQPVIWAARMISVFFLAKRLFYWRFFWPS